jgi:hypothetical protein|tara:strand:+ start:101 stop:1006 length:906 start_codon:yes stop_codon:yes gene_type:complete
MKKILFSIFFFLLSCKLSLAAIINIGSSKLEFPNRFFAHEWNKDFVSEYCSYYGKPFYCAVIIDKKNQNSFEEYSSGVPLEEIKVLKPIFKKIERIENANNYSSMDSGMKSIIRLVKNMMKKQGLDLIFEYIEVDDAKEIINSYYDYDEIKNMDNSAFNEITKEIKEEISSTFNQDAMGIRINKIKISRDINQNIFLKLNGSVNFFLEGVETIKIKYNLYITERNSNLIHFAGLCYVNCSKLNSTFDKIVNNSFKNNTSTAISTTSTENDFIQQLKQLNELYKSGILTKEEFEKAKKKLLN